MQKYGPKWEVFDINTKTAFNKKYLNYVIRYLQLKKTRLQVSNLTTFELLLLIKS